MPGHCLEPHSDPVRCLLRMASWWTVVLILQIGALWEYTHATTCTASTKNTCAPTLQVTGTCTSSVCDCMSGFVPTRTGCRGTIIPKIDIRAVIGTNTYAEGNGEVLAGGPITLRCNPDFGDGQYVWKKGTQTLTPTNRDYEVLAASNTDAGSYSCKIKFTTDDFETAESTPVTVTVVANANGQSFTKVPTVVGMPAKAFASASIRLACGNLPSGQTLTFEWYIGTVKQTGETSQTFTTTAGTGLYSCKIVKDPATLADFETPDSAKVNSPTVATTITGVFVSSIDPSTPEFSNGPRPDVPPVVYAESGNSVTIYCAINDTDVAVGTPTYLWKNGDAAISGATAVSFTKTLTNADSGSYTCTATVGGAPGTSFTSRPVQLNVQTTVIQSVDLVAMPATAITGGYVYLDCQVKTADPRKVKYSWEKNSVALPNVTDRALQINQLIGSDATTYKCTATVGLDSNYDTATITVSAITSVTPLVTCADSVFGVGNKYTLICGAAYTTPGLTYTWKEGTNTVTGQTSQTYEITVKATATSYTCSMSFGSDVSITSAAFSIDPKKLLAININVGTVTMTGTYTPVTGTSVTLTCVATLAAGATDTVTYSWTKGVAATGSGTSTLTITAGSDDASYTCRATIGTEFLESSLTVTSSATVAKPEIVEAPDKYNGGANSAYSEGGNYVLTCKTTSHSPSLIYAWTKGGNTVGNSRVYQITSAKKGATGDDGSYICSAKSGDQAAVASNAVTITIGDKGKPCLYVNDCDGDQYADVCENSRCVCATGYTLQGNTCSGQGIVTISMLLLVLCGVIKLIM